MPFRDDIDDNDIIIPTKFETALASFYRAFNKNDWIKDATAWIDNFSLTFKVEKEVDLKKKLNIDNILPMFIDDLKEGFFLYKDNEK